MLTPAQVERLALLIEECAEVQHIACKILRHGWASYDPTVIKPPPNISHLEKELGHLEHAMNLVVAKDLNPANVARARREKALSIHNWLHHKENVL